MLLRCVRFMWEMCAVPASYGVCVCVCVCHVYQVLMAADGRDGTGPGLGSVPQHMLNSLSTANVTVDPSAPIPGDTALKLEVSGRVETHTHTHTLTHKQSWLEIGGRVATHTNARVPACMGMLGCS